jgi:hypothetical protein
MLSNDYVEEYYRAEANLTTNEQTWLIKEDGSLVFTTPILEEAKIVSVNDAFTGAQNRLPESVNLIIDNFVIFSTNPEIRSTLPLKIVFDTKPEVEFGDVTYVEIKDYRITVTPEINLQTVSNYRFRDPTSVVVKDPIPLAFTRIDNIGVSEDTVYFSVLTGYPNKVYGHNLLTRVNSEVDLGGDVFSIRSNDEVVVAVVAERELWEVKDLSLLPLLIFDFGSITQQILEVVLIGNSIYVLSENTSNNDTFISIFLKRDNNSVEEIFKENITTSGLAANLENFDVYRPRRLVGTFSDVIADFVINENNQIQVIESGFIQTLDNEQPFSSLPPIRVFAGGSDITKPSVSAFRRVGTTLLWNFFEEVNDPAIYRTKRIELQNTDIKIYKFENTAYFYDSGARLAYFCNLDNFTFVTYNTYNYSRQSVPSDRPYQQVPQVEQIFGVGTKFLVFGGKSFTYNTKPIITSFQQVRQTDTVYQATYNYITRPFLYNITSDKLTFSIVLPNNTDIKEIEIFKYVLDYRIRYSKAKAEFNKTTQRESDERGAVQCKRKDFRKREDFVRCDRSIGDTERILGYVGEDFDTSKFLNLYTGGA